ncbi:MAG: hypothetical protein QNK27_01980 [Desulfuromusa sp.]|nr:hypothetical protein [Desulfuromusa sp.]
MLFYTSIFVASLIALLVARLIHIAVISSCEAVAKAGGQVCGSKGRFAITANASGHQNDDALSKTVTCASINPDSNNHVTAWKLDNMLPGEDKTNHGNNTVLPPRAAIGTSFGGTTKVRRYDGGRKKVTLDMVSKPFRRNAAPDTPTPETVSNLDKGNADSKTSTRETINKLIMQKGRPVKSGIKTDDKPWGW